MESHEELKPEKKAPLVKEYSEDLLPFLEYGPPVRRSDMTAEEKKHDNWRRHKKKQVQKREQKQQQQRTQPAPKGRIDTSGAIRKVSLQVGGKGSGSGRKSHGGRGGHSQNNNFNQGVGQSDQDALCTRCHGGDGAQLRQVSADDVMTYRTWCFACGKPRQAPMGEAMALAAHAPPPPFFPPGFVALQSAGGAATANPGASWPQGMQHQRQGLQQYHANASFQIQSQQHHWQYPQQFHHKGFTLPCPTAPLGHQTAFQPPTHEPTYQPLSPPPFGAPQASQSQDAQYQRLLREQLDRQLGQ